MLEVIRTSDIFSICRIFLITLTRTRTPVQLSLLYKAKSVIPIIPVSNWNLVRQDMSGEMAKRCVFSVFLTHLNDCMSY